MLDIVTSRSAHMYRLAIYLPENDCFGDKVPDIDQWVREACRVLVGITGGATRMAPATGLWLNRERNILIEEATHIVYSFFNATEIKRSFHHVRAFVCEFGRQTGQQSVAVEFAGRMLFISDFESRSPRHVSCEAPLIDVFAS